MVGKLKTIVWDAPDTRALADFYVGAVGLTQHYADDEWVTLYSPDGWRFGVQRALDHVPPQWPDPAHPQQMHVDFQVADIEAAAAHAESLGAQRLTGNDRLDHPGRPRRPPVRPLPGRRRHRGHQGLRGHHRHRRRAGAGQLLLRSAWPRGHLRRPRGRADRPGGRAGHVPNRSPSSADPGGPIPATPSSSTSTSP